MIAQQLNGTACAVPRMIIALLESNQDADGIVRLPSVLHPFLPPNFCNLA
jgi:seryl-tRNA synthetase